MTPECHIAHKPETSPAARLLADREALTGRILRGEVVDPLGALTALLDDYFRSRFEASMVGPRIGLVRNPYAIIALGGYGRGSSGCNAMSI